MGDHRGHIAVLQDDGHLTGAAVAALHAVSGVDTALLRAAKVRPSSANWLHAPWYPYRRGGALTIGRTIWFTGISFSKHGLGDGSPSSTLRWLLHLAHEVGHLAQAERFGPSLWGKTRYVAAFAWQYATRALLRRRPIHDGSPLEREADAGRRVLRAVVGDQQERHPLVAAVHGHAAPVVERWCVQHRQYLAEIAGRVQAGNLA